MLLHNMLDDTQPKPRAATFTRTPFIHPVKALENMRDVLLWNARPVIGNRAQHFVFQFIISSRHS